MLRIFLSILSDVCKRATISVVWRVKAAGIWRVKVPNSCKSDDFLFVNVVNII